MGPLRTPLAQVKKSSSKKRVWFIILPLEIIISEIPGYSKRCECGNTIREESRIITLPNIVASE